MVDKAIELAAAHGWFLTRQFENEANPDMHSRTTAREIVDDFAGEALDYWVTGFGTGGTLKGVARVLAKERPETKIVVCEPALAAMLTSGEAQARNPDVSPAASHPAFTPHPMQGWSPDFTPKLMGDAVDMGVIDRILTIAGPDAMRCAQELATKEGIFVGITSGATFASALEVCKTVPKGSTILCMLPDTGERYLSTPLFADVPADMTEEEAGISGSTPGFHMAPAAEGGGGHERGGRRYHPAGHEGRGYRRRADRLPGGRGGGAGAHPRHRLVRHPGLRRRATRRPAPVQALRRRHPLADGDVGAPVLGRFRRPRARAAGTIPGRLLLPRGPARRYGGPPIPATTAAASAWHCSTTSWLGRVSTGSPP